MKGVSGNYRGDRRLKVWRVKHRPHCPACKKFDFPGLECARVWAPDWAADAYPVNELEVAADEEARGELEQLRKRYLDLREQLAGMFSEAQHRIRALGELASEVEDLRRENARLRENADSDLDAANHWRRYVAVVGEKRASLYLIPPSREDEH